MKQKERQERSRQEILLAAMAEFGTHNYEDVTMEGICTAHGISKGMMYHYYANKDAVFLVCVEEVFRRLRAYIEMQAAVLAPLEPLERIRNYFVIRESYFQQHPIERNIFENAQFRPPRHLVDEIQARRQPLRAMNLHFLQQIIWQLPLRPCVDHAEALRYLESIEEVYWRMLGQYRPSGEAMDLHTQTALAERLLDLLLFGALRQTR